MQNLAGVDVIQTQEVSACNHASKHRLSYYICFAYQHSSAGFGYSSRVLSLDEPLESVKVLKDVQQALMEDLKRANGNCNALVIQSWQRLPAEDQNRAGVDVIQTQEVSACNHASKRRLSYYICFAYQHSGAGFGYSSRILSLDEPFESVKGLNEVQQALMEDLKRANGNCDALVIQSWQRLPAEDQ